MEAALYAAINKRSRAEMIRREFVEPLARDNEEFYGTQDGRTAMRAFELTFEHSWIYVFELVQNALDAGAGSIAFRLSDDAETLTVRHDGQSPIEEENVDGLSKVFRSTKGAASVGFMGIGFKSVFGRFREGEHRLAPLTRTSGGAIEANTEWLHMGGH
ncbi:MAG: hypothetical protein OXC01_00745 [Immundisolibacterales bacterium]|nr:hypothetical protein [Immundisolibacterales bacterium]